MWELPQFAELNNPISSISAMKSQNQLQETTSNHNINNAGKMWKRKTAKNDFTGEQFKFGNI